MKKLLIVIVLTALTVGAMRAQGIGLRLGYGAELSYQHALSDNRLELGLGLDLNSGLNLNGTYQWVKPLEDNFNWYFGFGAGIGAYSSVAAISVLGQLGIEYNFDFPLQLSLDWRPGPAFIFYKEGMTTGFWATSVGLGVRYRF